MSNPPRNVCSHPRKNIRLVTLMNGSMRIIPPSRERVQGVSRREWLLVKILLPITQRRETLYRKVKQ